MPVLPCKSAIRIITFSQKRRHLLSIKRQSNFTGIIYSYQEHTFGVKERKLASLPAFFTPRRKAIGDAMLNAGKRIDNGERNGYEITPSIYFMGGTLTIPMTGSLETCTLIGPLIVL